MALARQALSAFTKIGIIIAIAVAFVLGLTGTVYLSLRSPEVQVPDVVGKNRMEAEEAIHDSGLSIRVRATRPVADARPDLVILQTPRAGEMVKAGQTVSVDLSRAAREGESSITIASISERKPEEKKEESGEKKPEEKGEGAAANKNDNQNANKPKKNKNANNSNNANNANNRNSSNTANSATNANTGANRNVNAGRNQNNRNAATGPNLNTNSRTPNANTNRGNTNVNRRAPVITTPPFNPGGRTP